VQTIQNTIYTSTRITKTPTRYKVHTYVHTHTLQSLHVRTHLHITKQVKTTAVQDTQQMIYLT
jgi:hypothetical protein